MFFIIWFLLPFNTSANELTSMTHVESCFSGHFATYEQWETLLANKKKKFNNEKFKDKYEQRFNQIKAQLTCENFQYQVDGYTVEGYYLMPRNVPLDKLPVVIFNRGGNGKFGYVTFGKKLQLLSDIALQGYVVIGSQYRGASTRFIENNGQDEFGGRDVNDVLALVDLLDEIPQADIKNIAMLGWSRGVMQSYIAAKSMPFLKTIIAGAGNSDEEKALAWRPQMENVYRKRVPNFKENRASELEARSVVKWLDKLPKNMPILLLHGDKDKKVNVEQSIDLAAELDAEKHPHKLVIYKGGNHGLSHHRKAVTNEITSWLKGTLAN